MPISPALTIHPLKRPRRGNCDSPFLELPPSRSIGSFPAAGAYSVTPPPLRPVWKERPRNTGVGLVPARLFRSRPRLRPAGRPQGPPLQRTAGCRCSPVSTLTRRGGCPPPPTSFVPASGFGQAATRSAPTCVPARILLYSNQLFHTGGVFCGIHPPVRRSAGLCRPAAPADAHARPQG